MIKKYSIINKNYVKYKNIKLESILDEIKKLD